MTIARSIPLTQALKVDYASTSGNEKVYQGIVNGHWSVGKVPNGGKLPADSCCKAFYRCVVSRNKVSP